MLLSQVVVDLANFVGGFGTCLVVFALVAEARSRRALARLDKLQPAESVSVPSPVEVSSPAPSFCDSPVYEAVSGTWRVGGLDGGPDGNYGY